MNETEKSTLTLSPIGYYHSQEIEPYQAPRQPDLQDRPGVISLLPGNNFEQALQNLDGVDRIWVIFHFHKNTSWKPMVMPPRGSETKIGVFATRSPYRPNFIGLSCVRLVKIDGLKIYIQGSDLLNETPIFDIKPYVTESDSFPNSKMQWLDGIQEQKYEILQSELFKQQISFLEQLDEIQIFSFTNRQLEFKPWDQRRKKVYTKEDVVKKNWILPREENKKIIQAHESKKIGILGYRTWRILFEELEDQKIQCLQIFSGYSEADINSEEDIYTDKEVHRKFCHFFAC